MLACRARPLARHSDLPGDRLPRRHRPQPLRALRTSRPCSTTSPSRCIRRSATRRRGRCARRHLPRHLRARPEPLPVRRRHQAAGDRRERRPRVPGRRGAAEPRRGARRRSAAPGSRCSSTRSCSTSAPPGARSTPIVALLALAALVLRRPGARDLSAVTLALAVCVKPTAAPMLLAVLLFVGAGSRRSRRCVTPPCSPPASSSSTSSRSSCSAGTPRRCQHRQRAVLDERRHVARRRGRLCDTTRSILQRALVAAGPALGPRAARRRRVLARQGARDSAGLARRERRADPGLLPHAHLAGGAQRGASCWRRCWSSPRSAGSTGASSPPSGWSRSLFTVANVSPLQLLWVASRRAPWSGRSPGRAVRRRDAGLARPLWSSPGRSPAGGSWSPVCDGRELGRSRPARPQRPDRGRASPPARPARALAREALP